MINELGGGDVARMGDRRGAYRVLVRGDVAGVGDRRGAYRVLVRGGTWHVWETREVHTGLR